MLNCGLIYIFFFEAIVTSASASKGGFQLIFPLQVMESQFYCLSGAEYSEIVL